MLAGDGQTLMDDMAPDMTRISYCIRVRMAKRGPGGRVLEIADKAVRVRIIPAKEDLPEGRRTRYECTRSAGGFVSPPSSSL